MNETYNNLTTLKFTVEDLEQQLLKTPKIPVEIP